MNHLGPHPLPSAWNHRWAVTNSQWHSALLFIQRSEVSYKRSGSAVQDEQERTQLREGATVKASQSLILPGTAQQNAGLGLLHCQVRASTVSQGTKSALQREIRRCFSKRDALCSPSLKMRNTTHRGALLSCEPPKLCSTGHAHRACIWSTEL